MFIGASEGDSRSCGIAADLNPSIGGSHYADDIPALRWLRPLKPTIQRMFFAPAVSDLLHGH
jgi:hypothetical protein